MSHPYDLELLRQRRDDLLREADKERLRGPAAGDNQVPRRSWVEALGSALRAQLAWMPRLSPNTTTDTINPPVVPRASEFPCKSGARP